MKIIIKSPKAKKEGDYKTEGEISRLWYKEIDYLMAKATEKQNRIIRLSGKEKEMAINEYREAQNIVNQKVEEVYGKMNGVEITTTEMAIGGL